MDVDLEAIILHKGNNRCSVHVSRVNNDQTSGCTFNGQIWTNFTNKMCVVHSLVHKL